jgi:hypothetical protein
LAIFISIKENIPMTAQAINDPNSIPIRPQLGLLPGIKERLFGRQEATLKEDKVHVSWVSLLYMFLMSIFALKVFALHDLQMAFDTSLDGGVRIQASLFVLAIIGAVAVSDYAAPKAREVSRLAMMRGEMGQAFSLQIYAITVYAADGYAVLASLLQSMGMGDSIPGGIVIEIGIRVLLITFTGWMIHTVTQKQYPTESTLARKGAETTGGTLLSRITERDAKDMSTSELVKRFKAFSDAMTNHKEIRILFWTFGKKTVNNENWTKLEKVLTEESKTKEQEIANLIEEKERQLIEGFNQQIEAQKAMIGELTATIKELITSGLSVKGSKKGQANTGTNEVDSSATIEEIYKAFFNESPKKNGTNSSKESIQLRGIWVTARQVSLMINKQLDDETIKDIVSKLGQRTKIQVAYAANIRAILSHNLIKPLLVEPWKSYVLTAKTDENQEEIAS